MKIINVQKATVLAIAFLLLSISLQAIIPSVAAASVTPTLMDPWSNEWETTYGEGCDYCYKFDSWSDQTYPHTFQATINGNTITVVSNDGNTFNWTATDPICAVIVKAGTVANLFEYDPPASSDTGLYGPLNTNTPNASDTYDVSHATFCWNTSGTPSPHDPLLLVIKTGPACANVGDNITYTITVRHANASDQSTIILPYANLTDNVADQIAYIGGDTGGDEELDYPEVWTFEASYIVQPGDLPLTNTATADGEDLDGDDVRATDNHTVVTCSSCSCDIDIEKQVWDGCRWIDADSPTGPYLTSRCSVKFRVIVTNTGCVNLIDVVVTDPKYSDSPIIIGDLAVNASVTRVYYLPWRKCLQMNTATVIGYPNVVNATLPANANCTDTDNAYYFGAAPRIDVEKYVSVDCGKTWYDADCAPGVSVTVGRNVYYKFVVKNTGNVMLTGISLRDYPALSFRGTIPSSLAPGCRFTVYSGPVCARSCLNKDVAVASGYFRGVLYRDVDVAYYYGKTATCR